MAITPAEKTLIECITSMLDDKVRLGLPPEGPKDGSYNDPRLLGSQYLHGQINEMFAHKAAELTHHTGICAAFAKIHGFKYIDDPHFVEAMHREMVAQGIPNSERQIAGTIIESIIKELQEEAEGNWNEQDFGFHPNLDEIISISQPKQFET